VDCERPGDRESGCFGMMRPVGLAYSKKGWQIQHRCERCGIERRNRIADATVAPDDIDALADLAR
jgi:hypothetical protein